MAAAAQQPGPACDPRLLWAPQAWLSDGWAQAVVLRVDASGHWASVTAGQPAPPQATLLPGPVLPGLVNAHSHAFQRAFAGMAERRTALHDDFWSWRDRMYGVALRITAAQLRAVAAQLYSELLLGGYTQVCEFHYLHHGVAGPSPAGTLTDTLMDTRHDPLRMASALVGAAADAGIGLTLLPVLYERAGFTQPHLRADQHRFGADVPAVLAVRDGVRALAAQGAQGAPPVDAGVAIHSLRAAAPQSISQLAHAVAGDSGPIHIHIAEQTAEVDDCLAATGARPIEWLARTLPLDARWQLVHATHATPAEIDAVAASAAGVVLCPSTEANLGDGVCDLPRWLASATPLALGSDSHVGRSWPAELRTLEDGQRLLLRQRNVAADPGRFGGATAARLLHRVLAGGAAAAGRQRWGLVPGARADLLVLDPQANGLLGVPPPHLLDALVFASAGPALQQVWVAGQQRVHNGAHMRAAAIAVPFATAMHALWQGAAA